MKTKLIAHEADPEPNLKAEKPACQVFNADNEATNRIHERAETVTLLLEEILHQRHTPSHWGINE
jgi:hypothetical protein